MNEADAARIFRLNLQLSTETLTAAAPEIEALGLEAKEFFVLDGLEERPYPAELARHLSMPKPTVTLYLKNLQAKGLIGRAIDAQDLRRHRLELTALGLETLTQARASLARCYGERLARLSGRERGEFAKLLEKLSS
ncbi:MarR family transcriptional regulator [Aureimonas altamirensis]|uniref:MarR family winged helix-turn-helix transcriptional regulator n=1 Tax=Aureimonas altamirensis TaxID=370622 RepID=UPI001E3D8EF2|nr:MarR family transcriptional regulator [Aureimonas altamirensis]UHD45806.1 MarR family transcriptional regulator [Aureimonas altamirensis]